MALCSLVLNDIWLCSLMNPLGVHADTGSGRIHPQRAQDTQKMTRVWDANHALSTFWNEQVTEFEKNIIRKEASKLRVEAGFLALAASVIEHSTARKRGSPPETLPAPSSSHELKARKMSTRSDDVKQQAMLIHIDYKQGKCLTNRQRKIMAA
ncbi:predicted protein [Lichtheimia corymbifera JMRC:FSU:9682]|uniref:Uncharacterized protein n=1 Tax=Lichtheimia corymbifera JMRC:FSU:9682 TaxID=1263082 RepID=A0A068S341_9FUNG|nr:predicted protein [Lichtheimia corymbifera JMRC:FSU:9682]